MTLSVPVIYIVDLKKKKKLLFVEFYIPRGYYFLNNEVNILFFLPVQLHTTLDSPLKYIPCFCEHVLSTLSKRLHLCVVGFFKHNVQ